MRALPLLVAIASLAGALASTPARPADALQLRGRGELHQASVQTTTRTRLRAALTANDAVTPAANSSSGYRLTAQLSVPETVCYNDTIFRDSFDGTGL